MPALTLRELVEQYALILERCHVYFLLGLSLVPVGSGRTERATRFHQVRLRLAPCAAPARGMTFESESPLYNLYKAQVGQNLCRGSNLSAGRAKIKLTLTKVSLQQFCGELQSE